MGREKIPYSDSREKRPSLPMNGNPPRRVYLEMEMELKMRMELKKKLGMASSRFFVFSFLLLAS